MIPYVHFNKPVQLPDHQLWLKKCLDTGHLSGNGTFTKDVEAQLRQSVGAPSLLCTSGTHALEMAALLLNIQAGDEFVVPSYTFVSTANAFVLRGAIPRFADNDEYGNIKFTEIERLCSPRTKAIVVMHYGGNSTDMDAVIDFARARRIAVVEDAAQSIGAKYKGRPLGAIGDLGCFSFHETKNVTAGEGGALILGRQELLPRAEILREKGTNRAQFFQGLADKYTWVDLGSSYVLSDINAAYLLPQLEQLAQITERRRAVWERYARDLAEPLASIGANFIGIPPHNTPNYHLFGVVFPTGKMRYDFITQMKAWGVGTPFHYVALHLSPFGQRLGGESERLVNCERLSTCLARLPLHYHLSANDQAHVIERTVAFCKLQK